MKLIIDTNRIIAALIKNSYTRRIILSRKFEFVTLDFGFSEVKKYKSYILKKTKITEEEFSFIMTSLFSRITVIEDNKISKKNYLTAKKIMFIPKKINLVLLNGMDRQSIGANKKF